MAKIVEDIGNVFEIFVFVHSPDIIKNILLNCVNTGTGVSKIFERFPGDQGIKSRIPYFNDLTTLFLQTVLFSCRHHQTNHHTA